MPRDLVFELGVEEIPATYMPPAVAQFERSLAASLEGARISYDSLRILATPRRFAALVAGLADAQKEISRVVVGPPARIAFGPDGEPTRAAQGFARAQGVETSALEIRGDYVQVTVLDRGGPATEVLPACIVSALDAVAFPKAMRWGPEKRFARPIRWIVALLGDEVLDLEYAGVTAGRETRGLRFWTRGALRVEDASTYEEALLRSRVVADHVARRAMIEQRIAEQAAACGGVAIRDDELLEEVTYLVEFPTVFAGRFDERFLELPRDVVVAAMKGHQRYFAVESDGRLLPHFLCVANAPPDYIDLIRRGNEHVLESRLDDAAFYWAEDTRTPLESKVEALRDVVWLEGLGSLLDKTERLVRLAQWIADRLKSPAREAALRAARLAKADLVTEMVKDGKEFTELQGVMGREYALASGEPDEVAAAIREHYLPRFAGDALPSTAAGTILSIADRVDSIVGCFSAGLAPTGSQDPYALRRQAIGLIRTVDEKRLALDLGDLVREAAEGYSLGGEAAAGIASDVREFLGQRARNVYIDEGFAYDLVDAVLSASLDNLAGVRPRLLALAHFRENEDFAGLVIGARRVMNILRGQSGLGLDPAALVEPSSKALDAARGRAAGEVEEALGAGDFDRAVAALLGLRGAIDTFFDDVMVMVEDDATRAARLGLLAGVRDLFMKIADFALVVLEGEERKS
jgi:glycyl-tRNA synthetase beta chain